MIHIKTFKIFEKSDEDTEYDEYGEIVEWDSVECPDCYGSGTDRQGDECDACWGEGRVSRPWDIPPD